MHNISFVLLFSNYVGFLLDVIILHTLVRKDMMACLITLTQLMYLCSAFASGPL